MHADNIELCSCTYIGRYEYVSTCQTTTQLSASRPRRVFFFFCQTQQDPTKNSGAFFLHMRRHPEGATRSATIGFLGSYEYKRHTTHFSDAKTGHRKEKETWRVSPSASSFNRACLPDYTCSSHCRSIPRSYSCEGPGSAL